MKDSIIYGVVDNRAKAEEIVKVVVDSGVKPEHISFLTKHGREFAEFEQSQNRKEMRNWRTEKRLPEPFEIESVKEPSFHEIHTKAPEGATAGLAAGGLIGGTLGLLAGIGVLAIPGLGAFVAAGPLLALLSGIGAGSTIGGIVGALIGNGIPEYEAAYYENLLAKGKILLSIHTKPEESQFLKKLLEKRGVHDISIAEIDMKV